MMKIIAAGIILLMVMFFSGDQLRAFNEGGDFPISIEVKSAEKEADVIAFHAVDEVTEANEIARWLQERETAASLERIREEVREAIVQKRIEAKPV